MGHTAGIKFDIVILESKIEFDIVILETRFFLHLDDIFFNGPRLAPVPPSRPCAGLGPVKKM